MARMESDESDTKRVTVRVPAKLFEQYEEALDDDTNRSEDLRQHMREQAKQPAADGGLEPPTDDETLAAGYRALRKGPVTLHFRSRKPRASSLPGRTFRRVAPLVGC